VGFALCVAEKPSVANDIAKVIGATKREDGFFVGNGYLVSWAIGHLVGLCEPEVYGFVPQNKIFDEMMDKAYAELPLVPDDFKLMVLESTKAQFRILKDLMARKDVDYIIDCGDMGPEGHILQWFIRKMAGCTKPVKRFCATSMTEQAIKKSFQNLRPIEEFENIIRGEFCKKKADWILGMSMSRVASIKYKSGINIGRVQSPTLFFIVKRYLEVTNFKVTNYFTMRVNLAEGFSVFWKKDIENKIPLKMKDNEGRVLDKATIDKIVQEIIKDGTGIITELNTVKKGIDRPQLFDITELQREANRKFGYTASVTLANAQVLYERMKLISYPRTDSRYITSDLVPLMADRINEIGTIAKYSRQAQELIKRGLNIDKKIVDDKKVTDHHAIIVTEKIKNVDLSKLSSSSEESKKGVTSDSLKNILNLVLCRMLVSFSEAYIFEQTSLTVKFQNGFSFSAIGKKPISLGFKAVEEELSGIEKEDEDKQDEEQVFKNVVKGQTVTVKDCLNIPCKTTPPKLHTEATLLTAMENAGANVENGAILKGRGIGTQATRGDIIRKLFETKVVEGEKKGKTTYIKPTSKGLSVIRVLPQELYSAGITAKWETKIAQIAEGKSTEDDFMKDFLVFIKEKVQQVKDNKEPISFKKEREVVASCPLCSENVYAFYNKDENGKNDFIRYYCSENCGFQLQTNNEVFLKRLRRSITETEAKKFMHNRFLALDCILSLDDGKTATYKGEFTFSKRVVDDKTYCNIDCIPIKKKK